MSQHTFPSVCLCDPSRRGSVEPLGPCTNRALTPLEAGNLPTRAAYKIECEAFRKPEIHTVRNWKETVWIVKDPDVEHPLTCNSWNIWGNYYQAETWWALHFLTVLLGGAPPFQQHAAVPTVSSIHWPQANAACLAKCNFRSHWLTAVVHELVNGPHPIQ